VVAGLGGVLAEAHADTAIRLAPVSEIDVSDMLESLPGQGKNSCSMSRKST
jgi:acetyltransferase